MKIKVIKKAETSIRALDMVPGSLGTTGDGHLVYRSWASLVDLTDNGYWSGDTLGKIQFTVTPLGKGTIIQIEVE